jgi:hypothetical protein
VKTAKVIVCIQAVLAVWGALTLFSWAVDRSDDGQDGAIVGVLAGLALLVLAGLLATAAFGLSRGKAWARPLLVGLEGVDIALAFMSLFTGDLTALISFGLAITVLVVVTDDVAKGWLTD